MFWPFNHFRQPRSPSRGTIEAIYGMIVAQAREPSFYQAIGVADTVNGRFEMIVLHLWLVLRRIRATPDGGAFSQALFDRFCSDLDANLRELGVGDLTVPKRMQAFGEAFYGRAAAYDLALAAGHEALSKALCKNVLSGVGLENAQRLASYVEQSVAALDDIEQTQLRGGAWRFPPPAPALTESTERT